MNVLERIVAEVRATLEERKRTVPARALEAAARAQPPPRDFVAALRSDELAIIAEIKHASPSQGVLRSDFDPAELARGYDRAGAEAISVLTEEARFLGSLEHLELARAHASCPVLRKDFLVDPYQIYEARAAGADAVLLIASVLDAPLLADLHELAAELGMGVLVEVYDPKELDRIDFDQVRVLGVNNRDLRTFRVDVNRSLRVFAHLPAGVIRVSESGLSRASELTHLRESGVDAVLVGSSLMRASDPGQALAKLRSEIRQRVAA